MTSDTTHPVQGRAAFDNVLKAYIEFPTRTYSLLASLLFTLDIGEAPMENALSVILEPGFDVKDINLRSLYRAK